MNNITNENKLRYHLSLEEDIDLGVALMVKEHGDCIQPDNNNRVVSDYYGDGLSRPVITDVNGAHVSALNHINNCGVCDIDTLH